MMWHCSFLSVLLFPLSVCVCLCLCVWPQRPSVTADTMFYESAQQTFPVRKGKMSDIPVHNSVHNLRDLNNSGKERQNITNDLYFWCTVCLCRSQEEPEELSDSSHPAIVPLKDAPPITEAESHSPARNYITVHYSKLSR